jgi:hypothetical protein
VVEHSLSHKIDDGKPLEILRHVENKSAVKPKQAEIEYELLKNGPVQLVAGKVTFRQLAQYTKENIYVSAVYDDQETKIKGVRSGAGTRRSQQSDRLLRRH